MMNSKDQFLSDSKLTEWWAITSKDPRFDRVLLHASGVALESIPSAEQRAGVLAMKDILLTLADPEAKEVAFGNPGLNHDFEPKRKTVEPENKPAKKKN